jgi:hypothetical protein
MDLELIVKDPLVRGALALYPLFSVSPAAPAYLTGPEAERLGVLRVAEKPGGATVPELVVHNTGAFPLLLVEGETLVGAKQNRTLDVSVLVPAGAAIAAPVTCVEAGRWGAPRASTRSTRHAPADLRRVKAANMAVPGRRALKQAEVWDRIARYHDELATASPTAALEDAFATRAPDVTRLVAGTRPLPDQRGVAVAVGGTLRGIDCFDKAATLTAYWDGLCAGYALDAIRGNTGPAPTVADAERLVAQVLAAPRTAANAVGLGTSATLAADGVVGHVLEWEGAVVHVSAFVDDTVRSQPGPEVRPVHRWTRQPT